MLNTNINAEGYLIHANLWTPELAGEIAIKLGINLIKEHWLIINYLRDFHQNYDNTPPIRQLVKILQDINPSFANSAYLHQMFNGLPLQNASRIAGLPKPKRCL